MVYSISRAIPVIVPRRDGARNPVRSLASGLVVPPGLVTRRSSARSTPPPPPCAPLPARSVPRVPADRGDGQGSRGRHGFHEQEKVGGAAAERGARILAISSTQQTVPTAPRIASAISRWGPRGAIAIQCRGAGPNGAGVLGIQRTLGVPARDPAPGWPA